MVADATEESRLYKRGFSFIGGVDESGMGCFAGDVYSAVVIFPAGIDYISLMPGLDDSKKKKEEDRNTLFNQIKNSALCWAVASASVEEIDKFNIYWARFLAARRAIDKLEVKPDYIIMDGNKTIPNISMPQHAIVKGDQKSISIAAASILAKVERDKHITKLAKLVKEDYGWQSNKSYYCKKHIEAIKKYGKTKWHRKKFVEKYL